MKACPWCGNTPDCLGELGVQIGNSFFVICRCGARGQAASTREGAIDAWDIRASEERTDGINTAADFMLSLFELGEAIGRIRLGRQPESLEAYNASNMAEALYLRIKQQELCNPDNPFAPAIAAVQTAQEIEDETWGGGQ